MSSTRSGKNCVLMLLDPCLQTSRYYRTNLFFVGGTQTGDYSRCGEVVVESAYVKLCSGNTSEALSMFKEVQETASTHKDDFLSQVNWFVLRSVFTCFVSHLPCSTSGGACCIPNSAHGELQGLRRAKGKADCSRPPTNKNSINRKEEPAAEAGKQQLPSKQASREKDPGRQSFSEIRSSVFSS